MTPDPSVPLSAIRALVRQLKRYELTPNYRCGGVIDEMEQDDYGNWVRFDDLETALAALCPAPPEDRK